MGYVFVFSDYYSYFWRLYTLDKAILILFNMKKQYLEPAVRIAYIGYEVNFLASPVDFPGTGGENFDDPDDPFDPWS